MADGKRQTAKTQGVLHVCLLPISTIPAPG
jgi:hypothetical protein